MTKKKKDRQTRKLFKGPQIDMFEKSYEEELEEKRKQPVECLGMAFENDEDMLVSSRPIGWLNL